MAHVLPDPNKIKDLPSFKVSSKEIHYFPLTSLSKEGIDINRLPFSIRIILESLLRNNDGKIIDREDIIALAKWNPKAPEDREIPFKVSRILMQDFTGVPAIVDLATMRDYVSSIGRSSELIQPTIPIDLVIDHSVQVDAFNVRNAMEINQKIEMERNKERYSLLKWAHHSFKDFRVFPPSAGICHQVNLEYLATCVTLKSTPSGYLAFPDTLVGTDSHTTMINGMGIVGFGVGGIEAEAALLGEPVPLNMPKVLGVEIEGHMKEGVTAMDFSLTLTRLLREKGVVGMFVEFFGEGLKSLKLPDRATLSNMCPEYGATIAIFPVDEETLKYMEITGRNAEQIALVRKYYTAQNMFNIDYKKVKYSDILKVNLGDIEPSVSGPSQPKQQIPLRKVKENFNNILSQGMEKLSHTDYTRWSSESLRTELNKNGHELRDEPKMVKHADTALTDGDVVIASITSCTNTSNPEAMICAGLLARNAVKKGLKVNTKKVKTSLGPGSRVVTDYLKEAGLIEPLRKLGFGLVGFGCITCIGNSGPLVDGQSKLINKHNLVVASVLSGNRNYEARIHPDVRANYLMSPPLVVAFAIAGSVLRDLSKEPLGSGNDGRYVYLKDIWPSEKEIRSAMKEHVSKKLYIKEYGNSLFNVNPYWNKLDDPASELYRWKESSTYIKKPPFFAGISVRRETEPQRISNARVLAVFGDSVSTDDISPAGAISPQSPAGRYLMELGTKPADFNTYGSRRGNHEVMMRGTFANNRIKNLMLDDVEGGFTTYYPYGKQLTIYEAAMHYRHEGIPLVVIAGKEYGSGSSRDWAAKGPMLLGVKAILAKSFERIHRSNLIGMGILPLEFKDGEGADTLHIDYAKPISIRMPAELKPEQEIEIEYTKKGQPKASKAKMLSRLDEQIEVEYYKSGGVLHYVVKELVASKGARK